MPTNPLTRPQRALCDLIVSDNGQTALDLIGANHPTAKWFMRLTGFAPDSLYAAGAAREILGRDKADSLFWDGER